MEFTFWDLILAVLLFQVIGGIFPLLGVFIGGMFVLRTKSGAYEPLFPKLTDKEEKVALNQDDFTEYPVPEVEVDDVIEKILKQREEEDPVSQAHNKFKQQRGE